MIFESPKDAMPWVCLYIVVASLICTIAMAADVVHAFWQWKLWFPNRFFTLNAATITFITIAMKLSVDLTTEMPRDELYDTKLFSMAFLVAMIANFLPSLGLMNGRELVMNMVALGVLIVTIVINITIQFDTLLFLLVAIILMFFALWSFSIAVEVSATRKKLENRYKELQALVSFHQEKRFSYKEYITYVKKYWVMTETCNPQFVIACSPVSSAFGVLCSFIAFEGVSATFVYLYHVSNLTPAKLGTSDYKWSARIIILVQSTGIVIGSVAPILRCFTYIGHYSVSKKWSKRQLNVFRVEKHWIQTLQKWKCSHIHSHIPGRHCKIIFHNIKNNFLNFYIALHIGILVICKTLCLIPRAFLVLLTYCRQLIKPFLKRFKKVGNISSSNVSSVIEEYTRHVVQIEEDVTLPNRILRNILHSITRLLDDHESEKQEPQNLVKLLQKSARFNGAVKFDNDQVPALYPKEAYTCWSLVVVTLTSIAIALPNVESCHLKGLLASVREGLQIIRHIEECLNVDGDLVKERKAARRVWAEVEVYRTWLQIQLQERANKGKGSKEILKWLGDEAAKIVIQIKSSKNSSTDFSPYKLILANSMYRISQTILLECNEQENLSNDEELFEWISTMIGDILFVCFTNLPSVIKMMCHHHEIEKRGDNIRNAALLLGKSKNIFKILKAHQFPNIDLDPMAYIDKRRQLATSQILNGGAFTARIKQDSSSTNESLIIPIPITS